MRRLALLLALLSAGCATGGVLVGDNGTHRLIAQDRETGVTVILTTGVWDGTPSDLGDHVTVVHALVANMGPNPIRLAPGDIDLHSLRGFRHQLLDAGGTFSVVEQNDRRTAYGRQANVGYDPGRSDDYGFIEGSGDVAGAALPWGVLYPGTQMRGFLYFERIEDAANEAELVWHVSSPAGASVVDLSFQFYVARPRA